MAAARDGRSLAGQTFLVGLFRDKRWGSGHKISGFLGNNTVTAAMLFSGWGRLRGFDVSARWLGVRVDFLSLGQVMRRGGPALKKCPFCARELTPGAIKGLLTCDACTELQEWFPTGLSYMLMGEPGTGKSLWLYQVLDYYLNSAPKRSKCAFIAYDDLPNHVRQHASTYVKNVREIEESGDLVFVDGHSSIAGTESLERYAIRDSADTASMAGMLTELAERGYTVFCLDSLAPLAAVMSAQDLARGLINVVAKLKMTGSTVFITCPPNLMQGDALQLGHFADVLMEFRHSTSLTVNALAPLGLTGWMRGSLGPSRETEKMRQFRFYKARGRPIYSGWISFLLGKDAAVILFPDDPAALEELAKQVNDEMPQLAKAFA